MRTKLPVDQQEQRGDPRNTLWQLCQLKKALIFWKKSHQKHPIISYRLMSIFCAVVLSCVVKYLNTRNTKRYRKRLKIFYLCNPQLARKKNKNDTEISHKMFYRPLLDVQLHNRIVPESRYLSKSARRLQTNQKKTPFWEHCEEARGNLNQNQDQLWFPSLSTN